MTAPLVPPPPAQPPDDRHSTSAARPRLGWIERSVIVVVLLVWATGAVADLLLDDYTEPQLIHVIALVAVAYGLMGEGALPAILSYLKARP